MSGVAGQMARLTAGACTVFGTSYLLALGFDHYLTDLLVEATVRTLNDPAVEEEVLILFRKLLPLLLDDPRIRAQTAAFLKEVMHEETFEEAAKELLSGAVRTQSYRKRALNLIKFISSKVLLNQNIEAKITKATHDVVGAVKRASELPSHVPMQRFLLPHFQELPVRMTAPLPDFSASMASFTHSLMQFEWQAQAQRIREEAQKMIAAPVFQQPTATVSMPRIDIGTEMAAICSTAIPTGEELEATRMVAQLVEFELQPPQLSPPQQSPALPSMLAHNEQQYLTY